MMEVVKSGGFTPIFSGGKGQQAKKELTRAAAVLSLYSEAPDHDAALEELESFALDRLKVLRGIERARLGNKNENEVSKKVKELTDKYLSEMTKEGSVRKDQISHFVLRLAYCQTEDLRRWLVDLEAELLRCRFQLLLTSEQQSFLERNRMTIRTVGDKEFSELREKLVASVQCYNRGVDANRLRQASPQEGAKSFFKVPFEQVTELVRSRRVFLHKGEAYVPYNQIAPLVVGHFKTQLQSALQVTAKSWVHIAENEESMRLSPIIQNLSKQYLGPDYTESSKGNNGSRATISELPALSKSHFPLCMKHLYNQLKDEHHLKHMGRMQFGLFLKGIGLPLEEALLFWKQAFSPRIPGDKFEKQYAYNVRHNYGKEGKRADYTPYTCMKIIGSTPGAGEHHGCPYKTFSESNLRAQLQQLQISGSDQRQVLELSKNHHYQLACGKVFQLTNNVAAEEGINHPNQFYDLSRQCCSRNEAKMAPLTPMNTNGNSIQTGGQYSVTPVTPGSKPT